MKLNLQTSSNTQIFASAFWEQEKICSKFLSNNSM